MIFHHNPPVITGIGLATSIGTHKATFIHNLEHGKSGLGYITAYDIASLPVKKAFSVTDEIHFNDPDNDPCVNFALHAAREAIIDSYIPAVELQNKKVGVVVSSSKGCIKTIEACSRDPRLLARNFRSFFPDFCALKIMQEFHINGIPRTSVTACATGVHSIIHAAAMLHYGDVSLALAGASDASITPLMLSGYDKLKVYSRDDMRPFDTKRSGFLIGEGAGVMMLEREADAKARGAHIYARIRGFITAQDIGSMVHFDPQAHMLSHALSDLLERADLDPRHIDHVSLHGTSTKAGDAYEAAECCKALGKDIKNIGFTASKSMLGHMLGASGAVETIITALSVSRDRIFPTINVQSQDRCAPFDLNCYTMTLRPVRYAIKIAMGFGGHIGLLLLEK